MASCHKQLVTSRSPAASGAAQRREHAILAPPVCSLQLVATWRALDHLAT